MCDVIEASLITRGFIKYRKGNQKMMDTQCRRNIYYKSQNMNGRFGLVCSLEISSVVMEKRKNKWVMI